MLTRASEKRNMEALEQKVADLRTNLGAVRAQQIADKSNYDKILEDLKASSGLNKVLDTLNTMNDETNTGS